ncbi:hypothetical protein ACWEPH_21695 [Nocardia beijingensis]
MRIHFGNGEWTDIPDRVAVYDGRRWGKVAIHEEYEGRSGGYSTPLDWDWEAEPLTCARPADRY